MMKWLKQLFCKHKFTTKYPIEVPETWSYVYECGKCGYKHDVTRQVVIGQIERAPREFRFKKIPDMIQK